MLPGSMRCQRGHRTQMMNSILQFANGLEYRQYTGKASGEQLDKTTNSMLWLPWRVSGQGTPKMGFKR